MLIKKFIIREYDCSHKFVDDTKYQYNLTASFYGGDEEILSHAFSDIKLDDWTVRQILIEKIEENIIFE